MQSSEREALHPVVLGVGDVDPSLLGSWVDGQTTVAPELPVGVSGAAPGTQEIAVEIQNLHSVVVAVGDEDLVVADVHVEGVVELPLAVAELAQITQMDVSARAGRGGNQAHREKEDREQLAHRRFRSERARAGA